MFAGIIAAVGHVLAIDATPRQHGDGGRAYRLEIELGALADGLPTGASVAVNGACLTVAAVRGTCGVFDVVPETWHRTTLSRLRTGDPVNLERSLRVGDPIDGHFVQGHVEAIGTVDRLERGQGEWKLWVAVDAALMPAIVPKGSIALDGTSLTVIDVVAQRFSVALVPTTLDRTVLGQRRPGDAVNVETDILARLVARRLAELTGGQPTVETGSVGVSWDKLRASGFLP